MATINDTPVWVDGTLFAGNIEAGRVYVASAKDANGVSTATVSPVNLAGSGDIYIQVTGHSDNPACRTANTGVQQISVANVGTSSFDVKVYRSDSNGTYVFYLVTRSP